MKLPLTRVRDPQTPIPEEDRMPPRMMPRLIMVAPAPVIEKPGGLVTLDKKFVEGMRLHCEHWPGPFCCILRRGHEAMPFGADFRRGDLGFELRLIDARVPLSAEMFANHDIVVLSGDSHLELLPPRLIESLPAKVVYVVEYTLRTRLQTAALDHRRPAVKRLYSRLWLFLQEIRRIRAFRAAAGLQANGYPADMAYGPLNENHLLYLDNRMTAGLFATDAEMRQRRARLASGAPIRLIHSGRLEPMKGAQDLVPVALRLARGGMDFTLDIYGAGSLRDEIAAGIVQHGLSERVRLHAPVDFERELVPISRSQADIFLSCHRQSDPSCTYIESMGCGLPIAGYDNQMWAALLERSGAGWSAPMSDPKALAAQIQALSSRREEISDRAENGLSFARQHEFEATFQSRMRHLINTL